VERLAVVVAGITFLSSTPVLDEAVIVRLRPRVPAYPPSAKPEPIDAARHPLKGPFCEPPDCAEFVTEGVDELYLGSTRPVRNVIAYPTSFEFQIDPGHEQEVPSACHEHAGTREEQLRKRIANC
jgi:hypothetical protein